MLLLITRRHFYLMNLKQVATPTSALPARPERPIKYVWPVTAPDGSVGYDRPLENYFDTSMAPRLLPSKPPARVRTHLPSSGLTVTRFPIIAS
jgi:hypothetical protein